MKIYTIIGMMSGTSIDGVDAAILQTDGRDFVKPMAFYERAYRHDERSTIRAALGVKSRGDARVKAAEITVTQAHIETLRSLLSQESLTGANIDYIGFHGQTIYHNAPDRITMQIGDAQTLADKTSINTVYDFRSADVAAGGQGAPLLPLYHRARVRMDDIKRPAAILNLGGVGNITWLGDGDCDDDILAFDTGPANALMDDVMKSRTNKPYDENGDIARRGVVDEGIITTALAHPYFAKPPPKSLDRDDFASLLTAVQSLTLNDALATLSAFTVRTIVHGLKRVPRPPAALYVTGGGRKNAHIEILLQKHLTMPVRPVDALGWNGDALEAEGFAYLAARHVLNLPLSLPRTTGVPESIRGGKLARAHIS